MVVQLYSWSVIANQVDCLGLHAPYQPVCLSVHGCSVATLCVDRSLIVITCRVIGPTQ
jgi:hypothetical protein